MFTYVYIYIYRRRRGQEEGQDAAGGMTIRGSREKDNKHLEEEQAAAGKTDKSSKNKDKRQQEEGQEAAGGRTSLQFIFSQTPRFEFGR